MRLWISREMATVDWNRLPVSRAFLALTKNTTATAKFPSPSASIHPTVRAVPAKGRLWPGAWSWVKSSHWWVEQSSDCGLDLRSTVTWLNHPEYLHFLSRSPVWRHVGTWLSCINSYLLTAPLPSWLCHRWLCQRWLRYIELSKNLCYKFLHFLQEEVPKVQTVIECQVGLSKASCTAHIFVSIDFSFVNTLNPVRNKFLQFTLCHRFVIR